MRAVRSKLLFAAGLVIALAGCATPEKNTAETPTTVCRDEAMTGSHVSRLTCRPANDADRRAADQEMIRRGASGNRPEQTSDK